MRTRRYFLALAGLAISMIAGLPASASTLYVALQDGDFNGVALFSENLGLIDQVEVDGPVGSVAGGPTGTFYTTAGRTLRQHDNSGAVIDSVSGSATTQLINTAFGANNQVYTVLTDNDFNGMARFTDGLGLLNQIELPGVPSAIASGPNDTFFFGSGNTVRQLDHAGNVLRTVSGSSSTLIRDLSFFDSMLYIGLSDQDFNGVALFTSNLGLINQLEVAGLVNGVAGGPSGTFYMGSGNQVFHYDNAGNILGTVSGSRTTQIIDVSFVASGPGSEVPEPSTAAMMGVGLVAAGVLRLRRKKHSKAQ